MNKNLLKALGFVALIQFGITGPLQASIFKCVSVQGDVFYNDKPCPITHDEERLKRIKDPESSTGSSISSRASGRSNKQQSVNATNLATDDGGARKTKKTDRSSVSMGGSTSASSTSITDVGGSLGINSAQDVSETMSVELVEKLSQLNMY